MKTLPTPTITPKKLLKDPNFAKEWATPDLEELPHIRKTKGFTQKQLAKRSGMKQEAISRLENNSDTATLKTVGKIAYAMGMRAKLVFTKLHD